MRILVIGAGSAGRSLASRLCEDRHDVVLVDRSAQALQEAEAQMDILTIEGDGANPQVLADAGVDKADLLVAVTNADEVNILACILAQTAGVPSKIARVQSNSFTHPPKQLHLEKLGINLIVSQQMECAGELFNIIRIPGAHEVVDLLDGRALCVGIQLPTDSPLLLNSLMDFPQPEQLTTIRFIAYMRGDKLKIPSGKTHFTFGDYIYIVGEPAEIDAFMKFACPSEHTYARVVIAGGGELGVELARRLQGTPLSITLIESDAARAEICSELLENTLIINGSALNQDTMEEVGINDLTAFVAVTGNDENNIMSCLVAEKMGAHFTTARVENPDYRPIISGLSLLDRVVSPHNALINAIYHYVRGRNVTADTLLQKIPGEILEVRLEEGHAWCDQAIHELSVPRGSIIAMIERDDQIHVATGDLVLQAGDHLLVYGLPQTLNRLTRFFD